MERTFFLSLNEEPLYVQLYKSIRKEIWEGRLKADEKLPSIRDLSKSMNISKTTIENAYAQLVAEGYIYTKPKSGYFIMPQNEFTKTRADENKFDFLTSGREVDAMIPEFEDKKVQQIADFVSEYVDPSNFDMKLWKRSINTVIQNEEYKLFSSAHPFGETELKQEICRYFTRTRGINALPEQIVINSGTSSLLFELTHLFRELKYQYFAIEDPGYNVAKDVFKAGGFEVRPIRLKQNILDMDSLKSYGQCVIFTSPSYQFPFGEIMPSQTRFDLIHHAKATDSYIIEDDYNNELRYVGRPVTSLQGMDTYGRVIYMGSFSTILLPSIKISFMVLPEALKKVYNYVFKDKIQSASKLEQLALATMIQNGDFSKHIRKLRKNYRQKYEHLKTVCNTYLTKDCQVELPTAGLMAILHLNKQITASEFNQSCKNLDLKVGRIQDFLLHEGSDVMDVEILVLNYRGIKASELEEGIRRVKDLICQH